MIRVGVIDSLDMMGRNRSCWLGDTRSRITKQLLRWMLGMGGMNIMSILGEDMRGLLSEVCRLDIWQGRGMMSLRWMTLLGWWWLGWR